MCLNSKMPNNNSVSFPLDVFYKLSDTSESVRSNAVNDLLIAVRRSQESKDSSVDFSPDVDYTFSRLIKGLVSNIDGARLGFTLAFIQLLREFPDYPRAKCIEVMKKHFNDPNQDKCGVAIAHALALSSLIRAGVAKNDVLTITNELYDPTYRKPYTEIILCEATKDLLSQLKSKHIKSLVWPILSASLGTKDSPFRLWCLCYITSTYPDIDLGVPDPLKNINESTSASILSAIQSTTSRLETSLHPLATLVVERILSLTKSKHFNSLWKSIFIEGLLSSPLPEKQCLALQLIQHALKQKPNENYLDVILSEVLCRHLAEQLRNPAHVLHGIAKNFVDFLEDWLKEQNSVEVEKVLVSFFLKVSRFDRLSKTHTLRQILSKCSEETVVWYCKEKVIQNYDKVLLISVDSRLVIDIFDNLSTALHFNSVARRGDLRQTVLHFLLRWYLETLNSKNFSRLASECKGALLRSVCFTHKAMLEDTCCLIESCLEIIRDSGSKRKKLLSRVLDVCSKLSKKEASPAAVGLRLLLAMASYSLFLGVIEDSTIVDDFRSAAQGFLRGASSDDTASWQELTMEACLAVIALPSVSLKNMTFCAFGALASSMDERALQLLLNVFKPVEFKSDNDRDGEDSGSDDSEGDEDSDSSSDDSDELAEEDSSDNTDQLRQDLRAVLEVGSSSNSSDNERDLSDSEMFKMDEAIAAAFRSRMKDKTGGKADKQTAQFEQRCLELLSLLVTNQPASETSAANEARLTLKIIDSLLSTPLKLQGTVLVSMSETVKILIASKQRVLTTSEFPDQYEEELKRLMEVTAKKASSTRQVELRSALAALMIFFVRCYRALPFGPSKSQWYVDIYVSEMKSYLESDGADLHHSPEFFIKFMEAFPEHCLSILTMIRKNFLTVTKRKIKVIGMVNTAFKLLKLPVSKDEASEQRYSFMENIVCFENIAIRELKAMRNGENIQTTLAVELVDLVATLHRIRVQNNAKNLCSERMDAIRNVLKQLAVRCTKKGMSAMLQRTLKMAASLILPPDALDDLKDDSGDEYLKKLLRPGSTLTAAQRRKQRKRLLKQNTVNGSSTIVKSSPSTNSASLANGVVDTVSSDNKNTTVVNGINGNSSSSSNDADVNTTDCLTTSSDTMTPSRKAKRKSKVADTPSTKRSRVAA